MSSILKILPPTEPLAQAFVQSTDLPKPLIVSFVRKEIQQWRQHLLEGAEATRESIEEDIRKHLNAFAASRLQPVINGTGVLIHTNLGRSPLGRKATSALGQIATGYSNLEFDLSAGVRGARAGYLEAAMACLVGAEGAIAVNNCAAALVLILRYFCSSGKNEVIVSRSELVEIGGGFRIPEILETSGATLVEVGATNKTHLEDYAKAITDRTALVLKVHRSNFYIEGFTAEPEMEELASLCQCHGIPFVEDIGSGAVMDTDQLAPIDHEPTPQEALRKGVDLICFSGDKLLGGPQSGIIAGRSDLITGVKKEPFYRAVRCDKLILAVLQESIDEYLRTQANPKDTDVPILQALAVSVEVLRERAVAILSSVGVLENIECEIVESVATTGGGTMPRSSIPSIALRLTPKQISKTKLAALLRTGKQSLVGYIHEDHFQIDLRTVFDWQDTLLATCIKEVCQSVTE